MFRRRVRDLILVVVVCAVSAWRLHETAPPVTPPERLRGVRYRELPFQYQLSVESDGSATFNASLNCVSGTPAPGELGCQHLEGKVSAQQMESLRGGLRAAQLEDYSATPIPDDYWADPRLELEFDKRSWELTRSARTESVFKALQPLQILSVRKQLEVKRKNEAAALKKHK